MKNLSRKQINTMLLLSTFFYLPIFAANIQSEINNLYLKTKLLKAKLERLQKQSTNAIPSSRLIDPASVCDGRLTLTTANPAPNSDQTDLSTLYFTPYQGNTVALYDGSTYWKVFNFTEKSLALSGLTSGKNYDVFLYDNAGTLTLELSAAWTNDTTRADALTTQNGVYVKSGATTRRYLGTIRTTGTTTTTDTLKKRYVWNYYNRMRRLLAATEGTASWNNSGAVWASMNNNSADSFEFIIGINEVVVQARAIGMAKIATSGDTAAVGIGLDTTTANSAQLNSTYYAGSGAVCDSSVCTVPLISEYGGFPGIGYHILNLIERQEAQVTYYGTGVGQTGILGEIEG